MPFRSLWHRYISCPGKAHWKAVKWILRYLNGSRTCDAIILGYSDSDFAKDLDKGRSIIGYAFSVFGSLVSWRASLQHIVTLSSIEAEYVALTEAIKECIWLRGFVTDLGMNVDRSVVMCDNNGALQLTKNQVYHNRTKHINVKLHFIRDVVKNKEVELEKVDTLENGADMFTKSKKKLGVTP
ncbi:hypothetical protein L1987_67222 [Smallanthus sonchifolius]|uniref:Uncharacterized protein n=1 Tax=Smallanthus sonchifolius TaxID=185202 RepID=A0ACB9BZH7_9ASTR|nr:hypothetical protein L1987_67222 [Smallanthus sonchifolius]